MKFIIIMKHKLVLMGVATIFFLVPLSHKLPVLRALNVRILTLLHQGCCLQVRIYHWVRLFIT